MSPKRQISALLLPPGLSPSLDKIREVYDSLGLINVVISSKRAAGATRSLASFSVRTKLKSIHTCQLKSLSQRFSAQSVELVVTNSGLMFVYTV